MTGAGTVRGARSRHGEVTQYFVGTSGWHYDHWRGVFYPEDLPKSKWLDFYAHHFSTVEVNNTFYRLPTEKAFVAWGESSPPGFLFALKASRFITHVKRLRGTEQALETFTSLARALQDKLGPLLYQTPPQMRRDDDRLEAFLRSLPAGFRHVFEFRHRSWFADGVFELLKRYGAGLCVCDAPEFTAPVVATADYAYFRFHGSVGLYSSCYSDAELEAWAGKVKELGSGVKAVYSYFNNDACGYATQNAATMLDLLAK